MKILRLYTKLPPQPGGMEEHIKQLSLHQRELGHEVDIYFHAGEQTADHDVRLCPHRNLFRLRFDALIMFFFHLAALRYVRRHKNEYDLIHVHGDWGGLLLLPLLKRAVNANATILTIHDELRTGWLHKFLFPRLCRQLSGIFCTGYSVATTWQARITTPLIVQPSGIRDLFFEKNKQATHGPSVVTVANLVPKKRLDRVLEIAAQLPEVAFTIVGDGPERAALLAQKPENVTLAGRLSTSQLHYTLHSASVFLLTSDQEGTPTALLEAMACGLPVVTSNAGGMDDLLDDVVAEILLDADDITAYKEAIEPFLQQKHDALKTNKKFARQFRWNSVAKTITTQSKKWLASG